MDRWFDYESGHAWCESAYKYQTVPVIAEFANTVTNLPIIVLPLLNILLIRPYIENVNWLVMLPHMLLTLNGIASTYYHATLNLFGIIFPMTSGFLALEVQYLRNFCTINS
ncbi:unnamed protein product [Gongylonema pulchrum]|uniref:Alkaline ceramidase n=1 Tax=Gongylonema pulchrum TaxID=637853 RepID=A0A183DMF7_9BILA|nr:unnamed protein product [Gongylonema pulchrum]